MRRALPHLVAVACFAALAAALLWPALRGRAAVVRQNLLAYDPLYRTEAEVPGPVYSDSTMVSADVPRDTTFARGLRQGRLPLWNPLSACGAPLWAEQGGPFTPFKLPFYVSPSPRSYALFLALRLIAAAAGAYALARYRGLAFLPALLAGAAFELCGASIEAVSFGSASALPLLPWAVLGAEAIAACGGRRAVVGAAAALGLAGHGGHPTVAAVVFVGFGAVVAGHVVRRLRAPSRAAAVAVQGIAALGLGLALAAPTLLPLAELRGQASSYKDRDEGALAWRTELQKTRVNAPLALLTPGVQRIIYAQMGPDHEAAGTLGVTVAVLAGAGLLLGGLSAGLVGLVLAGVAITLVPPGLGWLPGLPGGRLILPEYAWSLIALPLTHAAGWGLRGLSSAAGRRAAALAWIGFVAALLALLRIGPGVHPPAGWELFRVSLADRFAQVLTTGEGRVVLWAPPALAAVGLAIAWWHARRGRARADATVGATWSMALVAVLAIAELVQLWRPTLRYPLGDLRMAAPPPAVAFLQSRLGDPHWRMTALPLVGSPLTPMLFGLPDLRGLSALPVERFREYLRLVEPDGVHLTFQQVAPRRSPLYDLAAARYLAAWRVRRDALAEQLDGDPDLALVFSTPFVAIYENRAALPRVRIVHRSEAVADAAAARARLAELARGRAHARDTELATTVLLEPAGATPAPVLDGVGSAAETAGITDASDPNGLVIDVALDSPGILVVADTYYPGWNATVDGLPAPIHPANAMFRAVPVPAGRHTVALRYSPASLRWGFWIAGAAALVCLGLLGWRQRAPIASG